MHTLLVIVAGYLFIGLALFLIGKLLNPKASLPPLTIAVVVFGWFPLVLVNLKEVFFPKRRS
jgi:hypothetical protein